MSDESDVYSWCLDGSVSLNTDSLNIGISLSSWWVSSKLYGRFQVWVNRIIKKLLNQCFYLKTKGTKNTIMSHLNHIKTTYFSVRILFKWYFSCWKLIYFIRKTVFFQKKQNKKLLLSFSIHFMNSDTFLLHFTCLIEITTCFQ